MSEIAEFVEGRLAPFTRERIDALAAALAEHPNAITRADCPMRHFWAPGLYIRETCIPAGCCVVGKIHLYGHVNFVLGDATVYSFEGTRRITGCETYESPGGVQRAVFAHAHTWWTNVHANPTNERDLAKLEELLVADTYEVYDMKTGVV